MNACCFICSKQRGGKNVSWTVSSESSGREVKELPRLEERESLRDLEVENKPSCNTDIVTELCMFLWGSVLGSMPGFQTFLKAALGFWRAPIKWKPLNCHSSWVGIFFFCIGEKLCKKIAHCVFLGEFPHPAPVFIIAPPGLGWFKVMSRLPSTGAYRSTRLYPSNCKNSLVTPSFLFHLEMNVIGGTQPCWSCFRSVARATGDSAWRQERGGIPFCHSLEHQWLNEIR